jgi:glycosyltransferase involved in cell wall biosynthesis
MFYDLRRKSLFDVSAILRLLEFIRLERIGLIHAHSSSLFFGVTLCLLNSRLRLIWHDHFGLQGIKSRPVYLYFIFAKRANAVFSVTRELARWSVQSLGLAKERVLYLPNFVEAQQPITISLDLPGTAGKRLVCVANIRLQKDHLTLLRAFAQVVKVDPQVHLFLVGAENDPHLANQARQESHRLGLASNVSWVGPRENVPLILANCDIGVLSSVSEGFPVVLLEYGRAGLAVVATQVGECAEILEEGEAGLLVPPSNPDSLAAALLRLLKSPALRTRLGERLNQRVKQNYSAETIVNQVCQIYEQIL